MTKKKHKRNLFIMITLYLFIIFGILFSLKTGAKALTLDAGQSVIINGGILIVKPHY